MRSEVLTTANSFMLVSSVAAPSILLGEIHMFRRSILLPCSGLGPWCIPESPHGFATQKTNIDNTTFEDEEEDISKIKILILDLHTVQACIYFLGLCSCLFCDMTKVSALSVRVPTSTWHL
jgi:hypothetical protein